MEDQTIPEMLRVSLAGVVLNLKCIGIDDLLNFPLVDRPPKILILKALEQLYVLKALNEKGQVTLTG